MSVIVESDNVQYSDDFITADYKYDTAAASVVDGKVRSRGDVVRHPR